MPDVHIPKNHEVETFTGRFVDVKDPQPKTIALEDVAHALANTCRFGGHPETYYSVAEHAYLCSWYVEQKYDDSVAALGALHHDDAEYVLTDVPRPIKSLLGPAYAELTQKLDYAICLGLNLPVGACGGLHSEMTREADNWALMREAYLLLPSKGEGWEGQENNWDIDVSAGTALQPPPDFQFGLRPNAAEALYLARHHELLQVIG